MLLLLRRGSYKLKKRKTSKNYSGHIKDIKPSKKQIQYFYILLGKHMNVGNTDQLRKKHVLYVDI